MLKSSEIQTIEIFKRGIKQLLIQQHELLEKQEKVIEETKIQIANMKLYIEMGEQK